MENLNIWFIFILGIIFGGILFSQKFRKELKKFIIRSGRNLKEINKKQK